MGHRYEPDLLANTTGMMPLSELPGYPATWKVTATRLRPFLNKRITLRWDTRNGTIPHQATGTFTGVEGRLTIATFGTRTLVNVKFSDRRTITLYSSNFHVEEAKEP